MVADYINDIIEILFSQYRQSEHQTPDFTFGVLFFAKLTAEAIITEHIPSMFFGVSLLEITGFL